MGEFLYTLNDVCPYLQLYWLPDNESVIIADCYGNLLKINTGSRQVSTLTNLMTNPQLHCHEYLYTPEIPDQFFFKGSSVYPYSTNFCGLHAFNLVSKEVRMNEIR
jgi:hypothetical protein